MATGIIVCALILIGIFSIKSYAKKLSEGCCGSGGDKVNKVEVEDKNPAHYPYQKKVGIEGMTCKNCKLRVENAFNEKAGVWARVDLKKKEMLLYTKNPMEEADIRMTVAKLGYTMTGIRPR